MDERKAAGATTPPIPRCAFCSIDLRLEILRLAIRSADGECLACPACARTVLDRLDQAHAEAGELLESWWAER